MTKMASADDNERYRMLKQMLEDRRREIQDKLRTLRETLPAETSAVKDLEEQSVNDFVQDIDFALMQMKAESLRKIDEAIHALEGGTYGTCVECEEPIASARLKALPFALRCVPCQENEEQREGDERPAPLRTGGSVFAAERD